MSVVAKVIAQSDQANRFLSNAELTQLQTSPTSLLGSIFGHCINLRFAKAGKHKCLFWIVSS
jgi:hypothetical protein